MINLLYITYERNIVFKSAVTSPMMMLTLGLYLIASKHNLYLVRIIISYIIIIIIICRSINLCNRKVRPELYSEIIVLLLFEMWIAKLSIILGKKEKVTIKVFNMDVSQEIEVENNFAVYCVE